MKIGMMGLGKLGLPVALAIEAAGHEIMGYDPNPHVTNTLATKKLPYVEVGAQALLDKTTIKFVNPIELVAQCDLIFVAVQTPHEPRYEGVTRLPSKRVDFNYVHLLGAIDQLAQAAAGLNKDCNVIIVSTVLPGTIERDVKPLLKAHGNRVKLCYNPAFIAMGTTIHDFTHPEFVLFGVDDLKTAALAEEFYASLHSKPFYRTTIKNAELIKVAYNTFISTKLAFVNTLMEVCHKTGCDVDAVTDALKLGTDRLISPRYMTAGMGDGGGCHPRDNIALSWLSRKLEMGYDFFEAIMLSREKQTDWFADLLEEETAVLKKLHGYAPHVVIMGKAFKPETNLTTGSPSRLLHSVAKERGLDVEMCDPIVDGAECTAWLQLPALYFIGTRHQVFAELKYPVGSTVIDPHRYVPDQPGVKVIRLGEGVK